MHWSEMCNCGLSAHTHIFYIFASSVFQLSVSGQTGWQATAVKAEALSGCSGCSSQSAAEGEEDKERYRWIEGERERERKVRSDEEKGAHSKGHVCRRLLARLLAPALVLSSAEPGASGGRTDEAADGGLLQT